MSKIIKHLSSVCATLLFIVLTDAAFGVESIEQEAFYNDVLLVYKKEIIDSGQILIATDSPKSGSAILAAFEKTGTGWKRVLPVMKTVIGKHGFAVAGKKKEGDFKTPSGIFLLGTVFGYPPSCDTKMNYQMVTDDDYWVDDINSDQYNRWIKGKPRASSYEILKRKDDLYKFGIVVEYNTDPVLKGRGSAVFIHVWPGENSHTAGCIAMAEKNIKHLLKWLDIKKHPRIIMGKRDMIRSLK